MHVVSISRDAKTSFGVLYSLSLHQRSCLRKERIKLSLAEEDSDLEIIYEDTKFITGADLEFKWG